jgi:hypothetical protein
MKYYHITKKENRISIQFEGLKSNEDGKIFLFSGWTLTTRRSKKTVLICDLIAQNQLGTDVFIIYEINPKGIKGKIENDNVTQDKISRSYVKLLGERSIDSKSMNEFYLDLSPKLAKIRTV